ncbi:uncharacterized protein SCHCODRAFT_02612898 [Schizophyllum commune H4-8]|uniref:uncharacterized protein n=1 Tax=Schizophyllum commune (strain H4-8 / FGSC 9210) TaxID=578458 RepID=UPI00215F2BB2|nr:uncharacterized protein SCHCODRAFT_02612898 [Schizophyllum commune H4-8]KAI5898695.1 hypothetical protein SCHCODRAFT_02612898 [Schizophyllum commune H4-8]
MATFGKPMFEQIDYIRFPSERMYHNQWFEDPNKGQRLSDLLAGMPHGRPSNVERMCTYPCVLTNAAGPQKGAKVKIQPLIGSADDGVYLRESDIKKLGLRFTGRTMKTRQGECKVYEGAVVLSFPNDYNEGKTVYAAIHVLELPAWVYKGVRVDNTVNSKKHGIVGIHLLTQHVVYMHRGDTHLIDLGTLIDTPALHDCCKTMTSFNSMRYEKRGPGQQLSMVLSPFPGDPLKIALEVALRCPKRPPFTVFDVVPHRPTEVAMYLSEVCRVCGKVDGSDGVKIVMCTRCVQEERPRRALYCSKECQRTDWRERHKAEHAGERPWEVMARTDGTTAPKEDGALSVPVHIYDETGATSNGIISADRHRR